MRTGAASGTAADGEQALLELHRLQQQRRVRLVGLEAHQGDGVAVVAIPADVHAAAVVPADLGELLQKPVAGDGQRPARRPSSSRATAFGSALASQTFRSMEMTVFQAPEP